MTYNYSQRISMSHPSTMSKTGSGGAWEVYNPSAHYKVHGSWINPKRFPEVTFENSPMEVELVLKK